MIELILTGFAWRRGWKGFALIPMAVAVVLGLIIGISTVLTDASFEMAYAICLIIDVICVVTLIVMIIKPRKSHRIKRDIDKASISESRQRTARTTPRLQPQIRPVRNP